MDVAGPTAVIAGALLTAASVVVALVAALWALTDAARRRSVGEGEEG